MRKGIAILATMALLAACEEAHDTRLPAAENAGEAVPVQMQDVTVRVPAEGTVIARNRAEITTRMMARVTELAVDVGSRVAEGQVLIRLGTEDIAANRAKAEAAVRVARAAREEAAKQAARMDTLLAQDVVAQVQRDQAHLQLTQAESQLAMAEATLHEVETAGSYASIRAPFEGRVVSRYIDRGDVAAPGIPLLVLEDLGPREAKLAVPADLAMTLRTGDSLEVTAVGGRRTMAPVRAVSSGADPMSKTVEVRALLPAEWPTGVSVAALIPASTSRAVTIPAAAVIRRGQLTGVNVVTANGTALRWIRLGRALAGSDRVEVLSGLNEGDRIVP